ncbi:hypothetical protein KVT40_005878 [Elsinoe batatas]|uniref:Scytalone dehydratase-like protein Arp1 N-terminal domain-containing protein n=1 Tax=Elsinoe batatas TaxID=2601811 RepID=A0A8K0L732_9PEZI|nr:hypothetical protein KVT40_005878 [Elsinoe batatas]
MEAKNHLCKDEVQEASIRRTRIGSSLYDLVPSNVFISPKIWCEENASLLPTTVFDIGQDNAINLDGIHHFYKQYIGRDDVFNLSFLKRLLIVARSKSETICSHGVYTYLRNRGITTMAATTTEVMVPSGPYVLTEDKLWRPWRIFNDELGCFICPLVRDCSTKPSASVPPYDAALDND